MTKFLSLILALVLFLAVPAFADTDAKCSVVSVAFDPTEAQATTDYVNLLDMSFGTTLASDDTFLVPTKMRARDLQVRTATAPGAGDQWDIDLVVAGSITDFDCAIAGTATTCEDHSSKYEIAKDSKILMRVISSGGASDPTASSEMLISFCLERL